MFPLNTVLFPGVTVPLHVFEDRYRALVHRLLRIEDPAERLFGSVAIREGYEVGERGGQSVHRIGCVLQLTDVEQHDDGTFDIVAVGRSRLRLEGMDASGPFLSGTIDVIDEDDDDIDPELAEAARRDLRGLPRGPQRSSTGTTSSRAPCPATRRTSPGAWPPPACSPSPTASRCWRPRAPRSGWAC